MTIKQIHQTPVLPHNVASSLLGIKVKDTIFPSAVKSKFLLRSRDVACRDESLGTFKT